MDMKAVVAGDLELVLDLANYLWIVSIILSR